MRYSESRLDARLSRYVECVWLAEDDGAPAVRAAETVLPDGCLEWIFHLGAPYRRLDGSGEAAVQPASFVVGMMTRPLVVQPAGRVRTMGVRFRPGGAYPFLRPPVDALTDAAVATPDLFGRAGVEIEDAVLEADDDVARRRILESFLLSRLAAAPEPRARLHAAVAHYLEHGGRPTVAAVAQRVGWSRRQLEREFRRGVGLAPKALARVLRFQNVLRVSGRDRASSWADRAAACGYADQAHLVREFRELSGRTPTDRAPQGELARNFVTADRLDELFHVAILQDAPAARR